MSGDGKDAGQETADEVHPPCPRVEPETEGLGREDDRGTLAHEIFSSSAAVSGDGKDARQETADEVHPPIPCPPVEPKTAELDREDDRGTELHGHGYLEEEEHCYTLLKEGLLTNEWFKMRTFDAPEDAAAEQGEAAATAAATGNTGSGQGTSCLPLTWWSKKEESKK